jgi:hypothetical protein
VRHFGGRLLGEGQRQNLVWLIPLGLHSIGNPVGDGSRLTCSSPRQDTQRAIKRRRDNALLVIEGLKQIEH